ncbi:hypothetical protein Hdeb2414_s0003g00099861 [Helianthus debilis subsp. tardiflorus]
MIWISFNAPAYLDELHIISDSHLSDAMKTVLYGQTLKTNLEGKVSNWSKSHKTKDGSLPYLPVLISKIPVKKLCKLFVEMGGGTRCSRSTIKSCRTRTPNESHINRLDD